MFALRATSSSRVRFTFSLQHFFLRQCSAAPPPHSRQGVFLFPFPRSAAPSSRCRAVRWCFRGHAPLFVPELGTITNITHTMPKLTIAKNSYFVFGNDDIRMAAAHLIILAVADALVPQCLAQEDFYFGVLARVSKHSFMSLVRI